MSVVRVRQLPLVPVSTTLRRFYAGPRLNCSSPAVSYAGAWQDFWHPKRAQANQAAQVQAQDDAFAIQQAAIAQADADSQARLMWATGAGVVLLGLGGLAVYLRKRKRTNPGWWAQGWWGKVFHRPNSRRRNRRNR